MLQQIYFQWCINSCRQSFFWKWAKRSLLYYYNTTTATTITIKIRDNSVVHEIFSPNVNNDHMETGLKSNPGQRRPVPAVCRPLCSNVRGLAGNLSDLTLVPSRYDILLCSETLVLDMCHVSQLLVPGIGRPVLLCRSRMPRAREMAAYVRDGYGAFRQH